MPWMKKLLLSFLLGLSLSLQAAEPPLKLGIFPYLSAADLIEQHQPLADYLSRRMGRPVVISSASDFPGFAKRTREGRYDLVLTAPHMGALAILRDGYLPLAVASNRLHAVIASRADSPVTRLAQLQNGRVMLPPKKAIISLMALDTLASAGLDLQRIDIRHTHSHNNALQSVIMGRSDAAAFSSPTYRRYLDRGGQDIRVLATSPPIPGNFLVANGALDPDMVRRLREALLDFGMTEEGLRYFKRTRQQGFRPIIKADLTRLRPFVKRIFGY